MPMGLPRRSPGIGRPRPNHATAGAAPQHTPRRATARNRAGRPNRTWAPGPGTQWWGRAATHPAAP
eukprot:8905148-Alexandrium_andersonii.AAC.1